MHGRNAVNKTLAILLLLPIGLVGCGKNNNSTKNAPKGLTIENLSGTYERVDGMDFKLVIDKSGTFKDYFQHLFEDLSGSTFAEQASGNCRIVEKEVHFHYQTPADLAESGRIQIFRVQQDGSLSLIAAIANGKRHDLSTEQQAETVDWIKRSDSVANKGFRIVKLKPRPAVNKLEEDEELSGFIDSLESAEPTDASEEPDSSSDEPAEDPSEATVPKKGQLVWVSTPDNPQNVLVEQKIRNELDKPTGELSGADLEKVERLVFFSKLSINDEGLKELAKLKRLRSLLLVKTDITDAGLRELAKLPELLSLTISGSDITSVGLKELANVPNLQTLGLMASQVTDEGLQELAKLKNLDELNLGGTKVTKAGVAALRKALPRCRIKH
jgi:hypothetical protein